MPPGSLPPAERALLEQWVTKLRANLWGSVLPFWCAHSVDAEHGGFFNCLDVDGTVYDTTKHVWLQGRQCWMFAKLATTFDDAAFAALVGAHPAHISAGCVGGPATPIPLTRAALIAAATRGAEFLRAHAIDAATGHLAFALTREGAPSLAQRKPFSAACRRAARQTCLPAHPAALTLTRPRPAKARQCRRQAADHSRRRR